MAMWLTTLATVATAICAAVAVCQTRKQVVLNGKLMLFSLRVERWLKASGLLDLFSANGHLYSFEVGPELDAKSFFLYLANNSWLEDMAPAIDSPLSAPEQKVYLTRIEEIRQLSQEVVYLFEGDAARTLGEFVSLYADLLHGLYGYEIVLDKMRDLNKLHAADLEVLCQQVGEPKYRERVATTLDQLRKAKVAFEECSGREAIESQIKPRWPSCC